MSAEQVEEMGPVDYLVVEWPDKQPNGKAAPLLVDLVDRGLIRILDIAFIAKGDDGTVAAMEISDLAGLAPELEVFEGASSGLLDDEDIASAGEALDDGTSAALLVY